MSSIFKDKSLNKYRCMVRRKGYPVFSKFFHTRKDAREWGMMTESNLDKALLTKTKSNYNFTMKDLVVRYQRDVSEFKKTKTREISLLKMFVENADFINHNITSINSEHFAKLRDQLSVKYKPSSICRLFDTISHIYSKATKEWNMELVNPLINVSRPSYNNTRDRVISPSEHRWLVSNAKQPLKDIFQIAYWTGMRRSEILNIQRDHIKGFSLLIPITKNQEPRTIPLKLEVLSILKKADLPFKISAHSVSKHFRKLCRRGGIENAVFHSYRHSAITNFSKYLTPQEVRVISGHKTLSQLSRYSNLQAKDLVEKINFIDKKFKVVK